MSSSTLQLVSAELTEGENRWPEPLDEPSWSRPPNRGRVLVVDDDRTVRNLIARILDEAGYEVETAGDGRSALEAMSVDAGRFDLVITDVRMPAMDGWELGRQLQGMRPGLPVLYISGYDVARSAPSPLTFLRKPFEVIDLLDRVQRLVGED
jgi:DNA-binding NtrC family response regulator